MRQAEADFLMLFILTQADGVLYFLKNDPQIPEPDDPSLIFY